MSCRSILSASLIMILSAFITTALAEDIPPPTPTFPPLTPPPIDLTPTPAPGGGFNILSQGSCTAQGLCESCYWYIAENFVVGAAHCAIGSPARTALIQCINQCAAALNWPANTALVAVDQQCVAFLQGD